MLRENPGPVGHRLYFYARSNAAICAFSFLAASIRTPVHDAVLVDGGGVDGPDYGESVT